MMDFEDLVAHTSSHIFFIILLQLDVLLKAVIHNP